MFRSLATAILAMIVAAPFAQAQEKRCDRADVTFSCKDGTGGGPSPYKCRAGESEKACCKRWQAEAAKKWCSGKEGGLAAFSCRCPDVEGGDSAPTARRIVRSRDVLGPGRAIDGDPDRPIVAGRVMNPEPSQGGAADEPSAITRHRAPRALRHRDRALAGPESSSGSPRRSDGTFQPERAYSGVRQQQGRVLTDSDLNSQKSKVCPKTRYDVVCKDGSPEDVNVACKPGEPEAACCKRGRHAAVKDCFRHGGVARMKCGCPRGSFQRVR